MTAAPSAQTKRERRRSPFLRLAVSPDQAARRSSTCASAAARGAVAGSVTSRRAARKSEISENIVKPSFVHALLQRNMTGNGLKMHLPQLQ